MERIFLESHFRRPNGRYVVYHPFNDKIRLLGKSKSIAIRQFFNMERKMKKDTEFHANYIKFMKEFEELGHLSKIKEDKEEGLSTELYLPVNFE